jgi:hypothetical protein
MLQSAMANCVGGVTKLTALSASAFQGKLGDALSEIAKESLNISINFQIITLLVTRVL